MSDRYYLPKAPQDGLATLDGAEAHHLLHVMRAKPGDRVALFDGHGNEFDASIDTCKRDRVLLRIVDTRVVSRELPTSITVGVALPKGDRQKWLVEKLTELGTARLVPLITERSVVELKGKSIERLQRGVIEACKQSGRNHLMQIAPPTAAVDFFVETNGTKWIAHPDGQQSIDNTLFADDTRNVAIAIGPEGGFTDDEVHRAEQCGWQRISLGPAILRIETAAVALVAMARLAR